MTMKYIPLFLPFAVLATESEPTAVAQQQTKELEHIYVIGRSDSLKTESGSISLIDEVELEKFEFDDIHRVLATAPGINIRQEDGYGLRPNIGFRGATPERSKKINIMEDGVLIGPSPYSAPAAYYFPTVSRMTSVEVVKGPAAIKYGPNTVAGTLNLTTRQVPQFSEGMLDFAVGSYGYSKLHSYYGDSYQLNNGDTFGFVVEGMRSQADGFKDIDNANKSLYDNDTGFDKNDITAKFSYSFNKKLFGRETQQSLVLKLGYADEDSNETYLGLTDEDFAANPNRRYASTQAANMDWTHNQYQLTHNLRAENFTLTTRLYRNEFERAWRKVNGFAVDSSSPTPPSLQTVLANPNSYNSYFQLITGERSSSAGVINDQFIVGTNDRSYYSQGLMSDLTLNFDLLGFEHVLNTGIRFHNDRIDRDHFEQNFEIIDQIMNPISGTTAFTTLNYEESDAISVYFQDTVKFDQLEVTFGSRGEFVDSQFANDKPTSSFDATDKTSRTWLGSLSAFYTINDNMGVYAGVHEGYVPTSPAQAPDIDPEKSINYEFGARYHNNSTQVETTFFFNDISNLIESCSASTAAQCIQANTIDQQFNGGEVDVYGLELTAQHRYELSASLDMPIGLTYTHTASEFKQSFNSQFNMWGNVSAGDELPYLPDQQVALTLGLENTNWQVNLLVKYTSEMLEASGTGVTLSGQKTDDLVVVDLSAAYDISDKSSVYLKADNLFDEIGIVSRRPYGARPSKPQMFFAGYKYRF